MSRTIVASFESKSKGTIEVYRGYDDELADELYRHASDPGIMRTLGDKDIKRFAPDKFDTWALKNGGRYLYTARAGSPLAGAYWIGAEKFPATHFPNSPIYAPYTTAWRTGYSTPEGGTYEGEGIGKRLALAGIIDVVSLTKSGGPIVDNGEQLPPLGRSALWLDTGIGNTAGQNLYHHLGNTDRSQEPIGFVDVGIYTPPETEGATAIESEPRVGMVADRETIQHFIKVGHSLLNLPSVSYRS